MAEALLLGYEFSEQKYYVGRPTCAYLNDIRPEGDV